MPPPRCTSCDKNSYGLRRFGLRCEEGYAPYLGECVEPRRACTHCSGCVERLDSPAICTKANKYFHLTSLGGVQWCLVYGCKTCVGDGKVNPQMPYRYDECVTARCRIPGCGKCTDTGACTSINPGSLLDCQRRCRAVHGRELRRVRLLGGHVHQMLRFTLTRREYEYLYVPCRSDPGQVVP